MKTQFQSTLAATFLALAIVAVPTAARAETAVDAVNNVAKGMQENNPAALWEAMPASYQSDVNALVHLFGEKVDANLYNQVFALANRTSKLMKDKKQFILNSPMMAANPQKEEIEKNWDDMVGMVSTLVSSDISKVENLKKMDVGKYLSTTGKELMTKAEAVSAASPEDNMAELKAKLANTKATIVEEKDGGVVSVKMETEGEEPQTQDFVEVEGKWVPKDMADGWDGMVAEAKVNINKLGDPNDQEAAQMKLGATMMIGMVNGVVAQLEAAETQDQFNTALEQIGSMLGGGGPGGAL